MQRCHEQDLAGISWNRATGNTCACLAEYQGPRRTTSIGWADPSLHLFPFGINQLNLDIEKPYHCPNDSDTHDKLGAVGGS